MKKCGAGAQACDCKRGKLWIQRKLRNGSVLTRFPVPSHTPFPTAYPGIAKGNVSYLTYIYIENFVNDETFIDVVCMLLVRIVARS